MNESERRRLYEGSSKGQYAAFLAWLFQTHNVVFVGINPRDIAVSQFIQLASETGLLEAHFWICSSPNADTRRWAERNRIRLIAYQPEVNADGAQIHSTDICAILDDLERHTSRDSPVVLPVTVSSADPSTLGAPADLLALLSADRDAAIKRMSGAATFLGTNHGFSSVQLDSLIRNISLPLQIVTSLDTKIPPFNQILTYKLIDKIHGSGSSTVWLCENQEEPGRYLVAKTLNGNSHDDQTERQSFRRGIESMQLLGDAGLTVSPKYEFHLELPLMVVMEYIPGATLTEVVESNALTSGHDKLKIFEIVCRSVRACHTSPGTVLHRDIKPGNIIFKDWFVGYESRDLLQEIVRLINFDLSWHRYSSGNTKSISASEVGYYAPEQKLAKNTPPPRTAKTDVYMLGMVLYYLIAQENPPEGGARLYDWAHIVFREVERCFHGVSLNRMSRLILNMTNIDIERRIDTEAALAEVRNVFEFEKGAYGSVDYDFLVENLLAYIGRGYDWDEGKIEGQVRTVTNATFTIRYVPKGMRCEVKFYRSREEGATRSSFGRRINERIQDARQTLIDAGWDCELGGGVIRSLNASLPVRVLAGKADLGVIEIKVVADRLLSSIE